MRYRWFAKDEERVDAFGVPVSRAEHDEALHPKRPGCARGEVLAIVLAIVILGYEWVKDDGPVVCGCVSFLVYELQPVVMTVLGPRGRTICNVIKGFSLATFIGALAWTFL